MAQNSSNPGVVFDLDLVENDRGDEKPFVARINEREIAFQNPKDVDWVVLADLGDDPVEFVQVCVKDEKDADWLITQELPAWKADKLVDAFMRHYGISSRRGNRNASRR